MNVAIPQFPSVLFPCVQIALGLFIGTKITREALQEIKKIFKPSIIVVIWTIGLIFFMGTFITSITPLNIHTAIMSSTMGGLPEMMVLALATDADISFVILMHSFRLLLTLILFPFLFNYWLGSKGEIIGIKKPKANYFSEEAFKLEGSHKFVHCSLQKINGAVRDFGKKVSSLLRDHLFLLMLGLGGGYFFIVVGVPAGGMIGAMLFVAMVSVSGVNFKPLPSSILIPIQISVGALATDSINRETVFALLSVDVFWIVVLITCITFGSSFMVAYILHKMMKWDFPTSFLTTAPGGFTAMIALGVQYNIEPVKLSMLHLCRLVIIKLIIPLFYLFYG